MSLEESKPRSKQTPLVLLPTIKAISEGLIWGEYFNSMLKCWEPLVDPISFTLLHEQV